MVRLKKSFNSDEFSVGVFVELFKLLEMEPFIVITHSIVIKNAKNNEKNLMTWFV